MKEYRAWDMDDYHSGTDLPIQKDMTKSMYRFKCANTGVGLFFGKDNEWFECTGTDVLIAEVGRLVRAGERVLIDIRYVGEKR